MILSEEFIGGGSPPNTDLVDQDPGVRKITTGIPIFRTDIEIDGNAFIG